MAKGVRNLTEGNGKRDKAKRKNEKGLVRRCKSTPLIEGATSDTRGDSPALKLWSIILFLAKEETKS